MLSIILGSTGLVYDDQGDYPKALEYQLRALKLSDELHDKAGMARNLGNIGNIFVQQGNFSKALDYYQKALKIGEELGNKLSQAIDLANIASTYSNLGKYPEALESNDRALKIFQEMGHKQGEANIYGNLGDVYGKQKEYDKALDYFTKALNILKDVGDEVGVAINYGNIGELYAKMGKYKEAEDYLKRSIEMESKIGDLDDLRRLEEGISKVYDTTGRYKLALDWYKKAMFLKDSLFNAERDKALTRKELTYQYEKKEAEEKAEQDKKDAVANAEARKEKIIVWAVGCGLFITLVFAALILRSLRITRRQKELIEMKNRETQKQKKLIEMQKQVVEEKNKEVLDSITYAKRLQDAILPPLTVIKKYLPESFVLYKPKAIVAGDFYWMERTGDTILIAACDCTGHGVPGAMVSVVCSNALNRAVKEFKITEPGLILDKVRDLVLETFEKSESEVKDGMDVSLCCINTQTKEIKWSGAYNPLWYVHGGELKEVEPDKQPIGVFERAKPFNTRTLNLQKGDVLYLFTDGYTDQFGGPKGKKFKYKQLQEIILANAGKAMDEQKKILENKIEEWKGNLEQVDDVLVMGIRLS